MSDEPLTELMTCRHCGRRFTWSYSEQRWYKEHGLRPPQHCPECRYHVKHQNEDDQIPIALNYPYRGLGKPADMPKAVENSSSATAKNIPSPKSQIDDKKLKEYNPFTALFLSLFLFGGGGHFYLGQNMKGFLIIILTLTFLCSGFGILIWMLGCYDAYILAKKRQNSETLGEWQFFWS